MNSCTQHLAIYTSGNKKKFIYDVDTDTTEYTYHESLKYHGNYSICIQEFMLAVNLYKKTKLWGPAFGNCKKTLKLIYITYWLESYRIKQQFYLEKWGAGMDFGKTIDSFCNILSRFCEGFPVHAYEYYLNLSKSFDKKDFIPKDLLNNLMVRFVSDDYSRDVFLDDIVDENGRLVAKKPFIKKYKKKFKEMGMQVELLSFQSELESYLYTNSICYCTDEEEEDIFIGREDEYEFVDSNEEILLTAS